MGGSESKLCSILPKSSRKHDSKRALKQEDKQDSKPTNGAESSDDSVTDMRPMHTAFARKAAVVAPKAGRFERERISANLGNRAATDDYAFVQGALSRLLLFDNLSPETQTNIVAEMCERAVKAGEILIQEGETGVAASELYVVKQGSFEVLEMRNGVNIKVNSKQRGDVFGEISLLYSTPRSATVAATVDAVVWVLHRDIFRAVIAEAAQSAYAQVAVFLNSVPLLKPLNQQQKELLVDALEERWYEAGAEVVVQGDTGNEFFIIADGEAEVIIDGKTVNRLFRADFFGEKALLERAPRIATVRASCRLRCLVLDRETFTLVLGPLEDAMAEAKSPEATAKRMARLQKGELRRGPAVKQLAAAVVIQQPAADSAAVGKLDEVEELLFGGTKTLAAGEARLVLVEQGLLGEGAFSRVVRVTEASTGRGFALKRIAKQAALQCPEHIFCEQHISKNCTNAFCIRQYASFQDAGHLYFLFDLMAGGDLMDVLVAEAHVVKSTVSGQGVLPQRVKMWQGMSEQLAKFYVASVVLALEYLHENNTVYRDLKPENVLIDAQGYAKLGDFGFAKHLVNGRTFTFCGTPGYVAPENVLGKGYNQSVDWWTFGVMLYVMLTARQPFSSPKTHDPMEVMRRIVDDRYQVKYPPYMSDEARDLIMRLLERKPARRLGMLSGKAADIKAHPWFKGFDWGALAARRMQPPRKPKESDSAKRKDDLAAATVPKPLAVPTAEEAAQYDAVFANF